ncbi:hydrogenase nickel incorporation protein HypB [Sporolactobacillus spathodeae]|uniref:Hydrogenase nickel incorporation protein HypB n=1 Tax=Sporolactobacillus spathodeae TaxID=1465502 RepID=A0ABS2Q6R3_9BACL|nr:hydrogenase nickel incorporation protein HypB [Sporolactobacillus spathodeae]MBM7657479.1 hydrogenase nickel incorporation protein HypB [Sporolactobacillus spathodeae]
MNTIKVVQQLLDWNEDCSNEVKETLKAKKVLAINIMAAPGAGKTSLILKLIERLQPDYHAAVIEGDIAGQLDAEKLDALGIPVVQLNTNGACHIEAMAMKKMLGYFDLNEIDVLFIENVGNLVCPAEFEVGEDVKLGIVSIPEGDDKVVKYPLLFSKADWVVFNKTDLQRFFDFNTEQAERDALGLNASAKIFRTSCETDEGIEPLYQAVVQKIREKIAE